MTDYSTIPADPIIGALAARFGAEAARAETQQARADALAEDLAVARAELEQTVAALTDTRDLIEHLNAQLKRAQHGDTPEPEPAAEPAVDETHEQAAPL